MSKIREIALAVEEENQRSLQEIVEEGPCRRISAADILNEGMIAAIGIVGEKFKNNDFRPRMLIAARAMKRRRGPKPHLAATGVNLSVKS